MKLKSKSLREMDWIELITYFALLREKENFSPKDLVDYFNFKRIEKIKIERWTPPNYIRQTKCAEKLLKLYHRDMSLSLIDILFDKHESILGKKFSDIIWSLGLLSSEKTAWILERLMVEYRNLISQESDFIFKRLLAKPQSQWSTEEYVEYNRILKEKNGQK